MHLRPPTSIMSDAGQNLGSLELFGFRTRECGPVL